MNKDTLVFLGAMALIFSMGYYGGKKSLEDDHGHPPHIEEIHYAVEAIADHAKYQEPPGEVCDISAPPGVTGKLKLTQLQHNTAVAIALDPNFRANPVEVKCPDSETTWTLTQIDSRIRAWVAHLKK